MCGQVAEECSVDNDKLLDAAVAKNFVGELNDGTAFPPPVGFARKVLIGAND
jgi:hypothetical protein